MLPQRFLIVNLASGAVSDGSRLWRCFNLHFLYHIKRYSTSAIQKVVLERTMKWKNAYICDVKRFNNRETDILKVFFAVLIWKSDSFYEERATNSTHFLYSYVTMHFRAYPILSKCGVSHRLFSSRFCQNHQIDRRTVFLHTFFIVITEQTHTNLIIYCYEKTNPLYCSSGNDVAKL